MNEQLEFFEEHRRMLEGLAYRMLGSFVEAQDIVQDTYLKWRSVDTESVRNPRAWLVTVCSRLALNALRSARIQRERYVGPWLPEPMHEHRETEHVDQQEVDESVSLALMLAMERLAPPERAAYLLHDVFGYSFDELSAILGKSNAACRKLASRARARLTAGPSRFEATAAEHRRLLTAFLGAARAGALDELKSLLSESVELHADGGGIVEAAPEILHGVSTVAEFLVEVWAKTDQSDSVVEVTTRWINGAPGVCVIEDGKLTTVVSLDVSGGMIERIYAQRNPEKLAVISEQVI